MLHSYLFLIVLGIKVVVCFEPLTLITAGGLALLGYNYEKVKDLTYCRYNECCNDNYINANFEDLRQDLKQNLFGQHILVDQLIPALKGHLKQNSKKPLVLSFHGTPGTGKNYVSDFIVKNFYKKGHNSKYVHKFVRSDFTLESQVERYKYLIHSKIVEAVKNCPRSIFIFDEVDKIPRGVFESIASFLDHHYNINGIDYSKSIFIFLSNIAGVQIAQKLGELMNEGVQRDDTQLHNFEKILETGAYNLQGGLQKSSIIESYLIDHYIPFLPLEKVHVAQCVTAEYRKRNVRRPRQQSIDFIMDNYVTYDHETGLFSTSGCKKLSVKVEVDVMNSY